MHSSQSAARVAEVTAGRDVEVRLLFGNDGTLKQHCNTWSTSTMPAQHSSAVVGTAGIPCKHSLQSSVSPISSAGGVPHETASQQTSPASEQQGESSSAVLLDGGVGLRLRVRLVLLLDCLFLLDELKDAAIPAAEVEGCSCSCCILVLLLLPALHSGMAIPLCVCRCMSWTGGEGQRA